MGLATPVINKYSMDGLVYFCIFSLKMTIKVQKSFAVQRTIDSASINNYKPSKRQFGSLVMYCYKPMRNSSNKKKTTCP